MNAIFDEIAADPEAAGSYAVLADLWQAAGDPRGELIAIQTAMRSPMPSRRATSCAARWS